MLPPTYVTVPILPIWDVYISKLVTFGVFLESCHLL